RQARGGSSLQASSNWSPSAQAFESFAGVDQPLRVSVFPSRAGARCVALVKGEVADCEAVPARVHSECLFGDALGSDRCECGPQLRAFMKDVLGDESRPSGILVYLQGHEGKGIGLEGKLRAYNLQ
ncbi:unnamed protein product, partial [Polarella glacialis]